MEENVDRDQVSLIPEPYNLMIVEDLGHVSITIRVITSPLLGVEPTVCATRGHSDINADEIISFIESGVGALNLEGLEWLQIELFPHKFNNINALVQGDVSYSEGGKVFFASRNANAICKPLGLVPRPMLGVPVQYLIALSTGDEEAREALAKRIKQFPSLYFTEREEASFYLCRPHCNTQEDVDARWEL